MRIPRLLLIVLLAYILSFTVWISALYFETGVLQK